VSQPNEISSLDDFVAKLKGQPYDKVVEVLHELDPAFVRDVMRRILASMSQEDRRRMLKIAHKLESSRKPLSDEELWKFVADECELKIPRKGVCEGHVAPFEFMADCYFERGNPDKLAVGNRGSGKTQIMGALHAVNARTKPKYTSCTVGAVEAQSIRAYNFFREQITRERWGRLVKGKSKITMSKTEFEHGGMVEIVTGTVSGVNSPHPVFAHFDEVELLRPGVFDEALNMAQSKNGYRAMNVLTSSWKKPKGFVSTLIDEARNAEASGQMPPYEIYRWCVWETTEPCPFDCSACPFANAVKSEWEDGSTRTFESACKRGSPEPGVGKLKFTDGFVAIEDAVGRFRKLPRRVWEAQQESKRPTLEGLVYDVFDEDRHAVDRWDPRPEYGPIEVGLDFGGSNPHAANFWQTLEVDVWFNGKLLPQGASIAFDEVNIKDVGNVEFGRQVNQKIDFWQSEYPDWHVSAFYGDPAARAAREDMASLRNFGAGDNIRVKFSGHVDVEPRIALVYELMSKDLVYIDRVRCPEWYEEVGGYEYNENTGKPIKESDHHMDAMGYRFWNSHAFSRKRGDTDGAGPVSARRPRAITQAKHGKVWDPEKLGALPPYQRGAQERREDYGGVPVVGSIPRRRNSPF
jgi:hypothetical protein